MAGHAAGSSQSQMTQVGRRRPLTLGWSVVEVFGAYDISSYRASVKLKW